MDSLSLWERAGVRDLAEGRQFSRRMQALTLTLSQRERELSSSSMRAILISLLRIYKAVISPWLPPSCRFVPTCSEYAREAIERHGALRGSSMAVWRLLRCQPFCAGGYDPVK